MDFRKRKKIMDDGFPPYSDDDTSLKAAASVEGLVGNMEDRIYTHISEARRDGRTCDECEVDLDMKHQTVSARIWHLHNGKHIVDSGKRRLTRSNRQAVVWVTQRIYQEFFLEKG